MPKKKKVFYNLNSLNRGNKMDSEEARLLLRQKYEQPELTGVKVGGQCTGIWWEEKDGPLKTKCWIWISCLDRYGYGQGWHYKKKKNCKAHRLIYELIKSHVPKGLMLDHLCRNRACVNPAHLEPVTNKENILRGAGITAINARKTHCKHGHPLSGSNLLINKKFKSRRCKICRLKSRHHKN